jgi:competence protein ComEC
MRGETIQFGAVTATCIASGGVVLGEPDPTQPGHDENDRSVALLIEWHGFRHFVGGDIERFTELKIADLDAVLDVDVYLANHHGSDTSSSSDFLRDLEPMVVIISNGDHGGHEHPRRITLDTLAQLPGPPTVYQTNRYTKGGEGGNVLFDFIADLVPDGDEGTIEVVVDGLAGTYTVAFDTASWTFPIKDRGAQTQAVVIESLLPDPVGNDRELEEVTIRNDGPGAVDLSGWLLQDDLGRRWPLTELGSLAAGTSATSIRAGRPLNLHNEQETVELIDPLGAVRDRFSYNGTQEGLPIVTGH